MSSSSPQEEKVSHLLDTAHAFDSVAPVYDGAAGNNALIQIMRAQLWRAVSERAAGGARLLDLGCGAGIDAAYFAEHGCDVTGIDVSSGMVNQTRTRAVRQNLNLRVENLGAQELGKLDGAPFDVIYSDLGPLNCVPDLRTLSQQCAAHLQPDGFLVFSVISRICPWEILYFSLRGEFKEATRRFAREMVPVRLNEGVVWTRYYSPREFYQAFENEFQLVAYRALNLFLPPPYLNRWYERAGALAKPTAWLDAHFDSLPILRDMGDHFLMIMAKRTGK